jgi:hypothetical protein
MIVTSANSFTQDDMRNVFDFLLDAKLPNEFLVMTIKDLFRIPNATEKLKRLNRFPEWFMQNKKFL